MLQLGAFVFRLRPRTHDEEAQLVSKFFELERCVLSRTCCEHNVFSHPTYPVSSRRSHYPMGDMDVAFCAAADEEEQGESSTDDDVQPTTQPVQHPSKALDGDEADLDDGSTARNPIRVCYLVSHVWYQRWKRYVGLDLPAPAGSTATGELSVRPASAADSPARLPAGPSSGTVAAAAASSPSTSASRRGSQAAVSAAAAAVAATAARGPEHPGYIDNDILCLPLAMRKTFYSRWGAPLRPGMQNGRDYVVLSKTMWEALHQWYDGGPILPRPYVPAGACLMPESYLVTLRILRHVPTRTNKVLQMAQMLLRGDADEKAEKPPEVCVSVLGEWDGQSRFICVIIFLTAAGASIHRSRTSSPPPAAGTRRCARCSRMCAASRRRYHRARAGYRRTMRACGTGPTRRGRCC